MPSIIDTIQHLRGKHKGYEELEREEQEKWKDGVNMDDWKVSVVLVMLILSFIMLLTSSGILYVFLRSVLG